MGGIITTALDPLGLFDGGGGIFGGGSDPGDAAKEAAKMESQAAIKAAEIGAESQQQALDYLKEQSALPSAIREQALMRLAGLQGLTLTPRQMTTPGTGMETVQPVGAFSELMQKVSPDLKTGISDITGDQWAADWTDIDPYAQQKELIGLAEGSPLYDAIMGGRMAGEEAILRNAAATGGVRGGNIQESLYDFNTQLQNQALLESYNQQVADRARQIAELQGLAGIGGQNTQAIANLTSGIGQTQAQGILGSGQAGAQGILSAAQIAQAGQQQNINNLFGLGQLGIMAAGAGLFSDRRLKKNIEKVGMVGPFNLYQFTWNKDAEKMGFTGETLGFIADEIIETHPEFIADAGEFLIVKYDDIFEYVGG